MCVQLLKLDLYYTNLMKYLLLHYSEIYQTITKYCFNLKLEDIILLLHTILLCGTVYIMQSGKHGTWLAEIFFTHKTARRFYMT